VDLEDKCAGSTEFMLSSYKLWLSQKAENLDSPLPNRKTVFISIEVNLYSGTY